MRLIYFTIFITSLERKEIALEVSGAWNVWFTAHVGWRILTRITMEKNAMEITPGKVLEKMISCKNIEYFSGQDYLVFFMHCIMGINEFVLVGLSENENFVGINNFHLIWNNVLGYNRLENGEIPKEWNSSQDSWSFRYKHAQSPNTYILKVCSNWMFSKKFSRRIIHHDYLIENNFVGAKTRVEAHGTRDGKRRWK